MTGGGELLRRGGGCGISLFSGDLSESMAIWDAPRKLEVGQATPVPSSPVRLSIWRADGTGGLRAW